MEQAVLRVQLEQVERRVQLVQLAVEEKPQEEVELEPVVPRPVVGQQEVLGPKRELELELELQLELELELEQGLQLEPELELLQEPELLLAQEARWL